MLKDYPSLLLKEESTAIKGVLILLIVFAHNSIIMGKTGLFPYLYSFHVYCFYILPFIYGFHTDDSQDGIVKPFFLRQWHNIQKLGIIYLFWCLVGMIAGWILKHSAFQPWNCVRAIILGYQNFLAAYCGFSFLWFIPAIIAVMFWRDLYFLLPYWGKIVLFFSSLILWGLAVTRITNYFIIGRWCPFALAQGLYFSMAGIATRFILEKVQSDSGRISRLWLLTAPIIPIWVFSRKYFPIGSSFLTWSCCPIIAFICLYAIKDLLCKVKFFQLVGKYSLQIYLLHTMIFNLLAHVVKSKNLLSGIMIYILTLLLCGAMIYCIEKVKISRWTIFPIKER